MITYLKNLSKSEEERCVPKSPFCWLGYFCCPPFPRWPVQRRKTNSLISTSRNWKPNRPRNWPGSPAISLSIVSIATTTITSSRSMNQIISITPISPGSVTAKLSVSRWEWLSVNASAGR